MKVIANFSKYAHKSFTKRLSYYVRQTDNTLK